MTAQAYTNPKPRGARRIKAAALGAARLERAGV